jgi:hypothetical protein
MGNLVLAGQQQLVSQPFHPFKASDIVELVEHELVSISSYMQVPGLAPVREGFLIL